MSTNDNNMEFASKVAWELNLLWLYYQSITLADKYQIQNSVIRIKLPLKICDGMAIVIDRVLSICFDKLISAVHCSEINYAICHFAYTGEIRKKPAHYIKRLLFLCDNNAYKHKFKILCKLFSFY